MPDDLSENYMDRDRWNEILNGERTYTAIANELAANGTVFIGWTDGLHSHFDILMTAHVTLPQGHFQRGINPRDLFVSIMSVGAFGFEILDADVDGGYVDEKFGKFFGAESADQLAHMISGVRRKLHAIRTQSACEHEWIDATNSHLGGPITSGEYCKKCGLIKR